MDYIKLFQTPAGTIDYTKPIEGFVKPNITIQSDTPTRVTQKEVKEIELPEHLRSFAKLYPSLSYDELVAKYNEYTQKENATISQSKTSKPNAYEQEQAEMKKRQLEAQEEEKKKSEQKEDAMKTLTGLSNLVSPSFYLEQTGIEMSPIEKFLTDYILDPTMYLSGGIGAFKHFNPSDVVRLQRLLKNNAILPKNQDPSKINALKQHLKGLGIDISKFSGTDFEKMLSIRDANLHHTAPDIYNIVEPVGNNTNIYSYNKNWEKQKPTGMISLQNKNNNLNVGYIANLTKAPEKPPQIKGISEQLYNASIITSNQIGNKGIVSGKHLMSPEPTSVVLDKYWNRIELPNEKGYWDWKDATKSKFDNPVYKLYEPTYKTPVKSVLFNPKTINHKGQMQIDWEDFNIYE